MTRPSHATRAAALVVAAAAVATQLPALSGAAQAQAGEGRADLQLEMTDAPDPVEVGQDITYTLTVTNNGPDDAPYDTFNLEGVDLTNMYPPGTTYKSSEVTGADRSCRLGYAHVSCNLRGVASGEVVTVRITVTADLPGRAVNSAVVHHRGRALDPTPSNNQASTQTTVTGLPPAPPPPPPPPPPNVGHDLSVTIEDHPDPVQRGGDITYVIRVSNAGPADMTGNINVEGLIAATRSTHRRSESTKGACFGETVGNEFRCAIPGLGVGESVIIVVVIGAPDQDEVVTASVTVEGGIERNPADNSASTTTTVGDGIPDDAPPLPPLPEVPAYDLAVSVADSPDPVAKNEDLTYTVTVANVGSAPSDASAMTLLHAGSDGDFHNNRASVGSPPGKPCERGRVGTVNCRVGALAPGASETFTLVLGVAEARPMWALVQVVSFNDPNQTNNFAIETTNASAGPGAPGQASLSIGMEDDADPVKATRELTYTLTVRNDGPETANDVVVTDLLPAGVTFRSASSGCSFDEGSRTVTCRRATQGAGITMTSTIVVVPERAATLTNAAQVSSATPDADTSDNSVQESTTVEPAADLSVLASSGSDTAEVGTEITYTVTVANQGPDPAQAVRLVTTLSESLAYRSSSSGCSFDASSSTVTCALGEREASQSVSVNITAVPVKAERITTVAKVDSATFDPDTSDNQASTVVEAGCRAIGLPGDGQVAYRSGWALVGLPEGTRVPADSKLYAWFDRNDGDYSTHEPSDPVRGGHGYWARFACPRLVDVGPGTTTTAFPLGAYRASMVGNPLGTQPVTVSGHDFAALWDPSLNDGAGGYRYSDYQEPIALAPGEGAWVFAFDSTEIRMQP